MSSTPKAKSKANLTVVPKSGNEGDLIEPPESQTTWVKRRLAEMDDTRNTLRDARIAKIEDQGNGQVERRQRDQDIYDQFDRDLKEISSKRDRALAESRETYETCTASLDATILELETDQANEWESFYNDALATWGVDYRKVKAQLAENLSGPFLPN